MSKVKPKSPGIILLLSILTCGVYMFFWIYQTTEDLRKLSNTTKFPSGITVILLTIVTCGIYNIYWYYLVGASIESIYTQRGIVSPVKSTKYLVLDLIATILSFCCGIGAILGLLLPMFIQADINNVLGFINDNDDNFDFGPQSGCGDIPGPQGPIAPESQAMSQMGQTIQMPHPGVTVRSSNVEQAIDEIDQDISKY